jgi:hypothetical protein
MEGRFALIRKALADLGPFGGRENDHAMPGMVSWLVHRSEREE